MFFQDPGTFLGEPFRKSEPVRASLRHAAASLQMEGQRLILLETNKA